MVFGTASACVVLIPKGGSNCYTCNNCPGTFHDNCCLTWVGKFLLVDCAGQVIPNCGIIDVGTKVGCQRHGTGNPKKSRTIGKKS